MKKNNITAFTLAKLRKRVSAFTLIELLVVISIIAILASIALPAFTSVQQRGKQTKALSNAKQIALALRLYGSDHDGVYPSTTVDASGNPTTTDVANSNAAFAQLFPTYIKNEAIFWVGGSRFCNPTAPDEQQDTTPGPNTLTLAAGENEWAYVLHLNDTFNPSVPMIADGFASASGHTYVKDQTAQGGVWKGQQAIVVRADGSSGAALKVDQGTLTVTGPNATTGGAPGDIFITTNGANGWLGSTNTVVNPNPAP
jgi:prepilin-type N-terminal cleavage/methylation domain-containing protein